jgi:F-type H+-transporting ATPase subunit gamma
MVTLREIRRRLRSVENIKQITKTMEMVAAARLRKAQAKAEQARPYAEGIKGILENLSDSSLTHPLFEQREVKKTGLVVVSGDRGLCGAYNSHIFSAADKFLKERPKDSVELILLGSKAVDYYQNKKWPIRYSFTHWGGKITLSQIKSLAEQLEVWFLEEELDEIWLIYTHYISLLSRTVIVEKFLNISEPKHEKKSDLLLDYIFEPTPEEIYAEILPHYCLTKIQNALAEAYASELAARFIAMGAATKNAEEMIVDLTMVRNKVRQAGITKEMLEIISGAERVS